MAVLNLVQEEGQAVAVDYGKLEMVFSNKLTAGQKLANVVGKVIVITPVFQTRGTVFLTEKGLTLSTSSIKTGEKTWFNNVTMSQEVRLHILKAFDAWRNGARQEPWYLRKAGEHKVAVTAERTNEDLGIINIFASGRLSAKQKSAGMVARVAVQTELGTVRGASIFKSQFGDELYLVPASEGTDDNRVPAYRLTREAEAQVLMFLHNNVKFDEEPETSSGFLAVTEEMKEILSGDTQVEDEVADVPFTVDDSEEILTQ